MILSIRRKRYSLRFLLLKILFFAICIITLVSIVVSLSSTAVNKSKSTSLLSQVEKLNSDNTNLKLENTNLESDIVKNKTLYKETMANSKIAYLTFDDGPSNNTTAILTILKQYNIKATFFVNGHPANSNLYKQMSNDGHVLGNHTYSHIYNKIYSSPNNFKKDVKKLDKFLTDVTGVEPSNILRYPGGSNNEVSFSYGGKAIMNDILNEMNAEGYTYFDWNVDSSDASTFRQGKDKIVQAVLTQSSSLKHPIILMHDLDPKTTTVEALPEIIEGLQNRGFKFDVLSNNIYAPQFKIAI